MGNGFIPDFSYFFLDYIKHDIKIHDMKNDMRLCVNDIN